ncbi:MAG: NERD domain-containing protein kinase family protein [Candidatus Muiribacteriota bacterium]
MNNQKFDCQFIIQTINNIKINKNKNNISPHKYIFLLTLIDLYKKDSNRENKFYLDQELVNKFQKKINEFKIKDKQNQLLIEYPFYYLANDAIWFHKLKKSKEILYKDYVESVKRLTRKKLLETVEYGYLEESLHNALSDKNCRDEICAFLINKIQKESKIFLKSKPLRGNVNHSLYQHEADAIDSLSIKIKSGNLGFVCSNIEVCDPSSNKYYEIDFFVVSPFGIYVVELKHLKANIEIKPHKWKINGHFKKDFHLLNNSKARIIKGLCQNKFSYLEIPYVESVVVLTHPNAEVTGDSSIKTKKNQPSFSSIERFVSYLKYQKETKPSIIDTELAKSVCNYIKNLSEPGKSKSFDLPGYEIVEYLYRGEDRDEFLAKRIDTNIRRLQRLRVFYEPLNNIDDSVYKEAKERSKRNLETVANIDGHPNILDVIEVPNDYGYIIESSYWSEQGTLEDYISENAPIPKSKATFYIQGILNGLKSCHENEIVHRNLSPDNILIVNDIPKIMNFDLSFHAIGVEHTVMAEPENLKKSPYMAPEIYMGSSDYKSDLFSLGVIFYEMLTGELPFKNSQELINTDGCLSSKFKNKISETGLSEDLQDIIFDLIQYDLVKRPDTEDIYEKINQTENQKQKYSNNPLSPDDVDVNEQFKIIEYFKDKGSDAQIYKAYGPLKEELCLKLFNIDVPQERIINEKEMSSLVSHSDIIKSKYCQKWSDKRWLVAFKWVEGSSLRELINKELPDFDKFIQIGKKLIYLVKMLHTYSDKPVLHNDIKPENIIVSQDNENSPKLIDFGIASYPDIKTYAGTEGYVPPDNVSDSDRDFCEDGDLFALGVTLFEYFFGKKPYKHLSAGAEVADINNLRDDLTKDLKQWFFQAVNTKFQFRFSSAQEMEDEFLVAIGEKSLENIDSQSKTIEKEEKFETEIPENHDLAKVEFKPDIIEGPNPFVEYLNTLHTLNSNSSNMLAESQACTEWFKYIHVKHPLVETIKNEIVNNKKDVILTGHAGDGKTTIALELFKDLKGLSNEEELDKPLDKQELINEKIKIIKDFSEWKTEEWVEIINDSKQNDSPVMLLVSNTGTLIEAFKASDKNNGAKNLLESESRLLEAFSESRPAPFFHNGKEYIIINLAMFDNLNIARDIFDKIIKSEAWAKCDNCEQQVNCPVKINIDILNNNKFAVKRIFYIYRRLFEYGCRFTLRQIVEHLAYIITSGMNYNDIIEYSNKPNPPLLTELLFFNRFFGDSGKFKDFKADQISIIKKIKEMEIGQEISSELERKLWVRGQSLDCDIDNWLGKSQLNKLMGIGSGKINHNKSYQHYARRQVRRIIYFLYDFSAKYNDIHFISENYISKFLASPMFLKFIKWKDDYTQLKEIEKKHLKVRILHVLQEYFSGVRIPEESSFKGNLYITLARRKFDVKQNTQVVLSDFREKDFDLRIKEKDDGVKKKNTLVFTGIGPLDDAELELELPFLDYVINRHYGNITQSLNSGFCDRIEAFKAKLLTLNKNSYNKNLTLINIKTDNSFVEQQFFIENNSLEVTKNA